MAEVGRTEFKSDTSSLYPDNTAGEISPADLRAQVDNIADSAPFRGTSKTTGPTVNDDSAGTAGFGTYDEGDFWIDETNNNVYVCIDSSVGAAIWLPCAGQLNVTKSGTAAVTQVPIWLNDGELIGSADFTYDSGSLEIDHAQPTIKLLENPGVTADEAQWQIRVNNDVLSIKGLNDLGTAGTDYAQFTRIGNQLSTFDLTLSGSVATRLKPNGVDFTGANTTIQTTDTSSLVLGTDSNPRMTIHGVNKQTTFHGIGTSTLKMKLGDASTSTGDTSLTLGEGRTDDGSCRFDFIADAATYTTYATRAIRSAGENGNFTMTNRGTGNFEISANEAGQVIISTNNVNALVLDSSQNAAFSGDISMTKAGGRLNISENAATSLVITNITQADPAVVTVVATTGLHNGDYVLLSGVVGMTQVNGNRYEISGVGATTFALTGINSTGFTAYTSDGIADLNVGEFKVAMINPGVPVTTLGNESPHALRFLTDDTSRLSIDANGNVGIGTNDATAGLLVLNAETPNLVFNNISASNIGEINLDTAEMTIGVDAVNGIASSKINLNVDGVTQAYVDEYGFHGLHQYIADVSTAYTLTLTDIGARITMNNAAANVVTIPPNATVAFPIGTEIRVIQLGVGVTSITADAAVTLNTVVTGTGALATGGDFTDILKIGADEWLAVGDIGVVA